MLGLIPRTLLDLVISAADHDAVVEVKRRAGIPLEHEYHFAEAYDDAEWQRLLEAALEVLQISPDHAYAAFADYFFKDALNRFPMWFKMCRSAQEFLERQPAIHNTFTSSIEDAASRQNVVDKFRVESRENELITHYRSPNRLCGLYVVLAQKILEHYNEQATVTHARCMLSGAEECEIHIVW